MRFPFATRQILLAYTADRELLAGQVAIRQRTERLLRGLRRARTDIESVQHSLVPEQCAEAE